ncbi:MAG: hypothetical protein MJ060_04325 [Clostridia bacterium]|nr:hypothetical protein [Clostridia bacterium]
MLVSFTIKGHKNIHVNTDCGHIVFKKGQKTFRIAQNDFIEIIDRFLFRAGRTCENCRWRGMEYWCQNYDFQSDRYHYCADFEWESEVQD